MIRRTISLLILLVVFCQVLAFAAPQPPQIDAEAAIVMVAKTQRVLFAKNEYGIMYPASTTKITTLLTALERGNLNSVVTVSEKATACDGSSLELRSGDKLTLRELLTGMMLVSGNDAAEAVAEHVAGSVPNFVKLMNNKANTIGMANTNFSNPHGLPDPYNHYTTAFDLARITAIGFQNPEFARIVSLREYNVKFLNRPSLKVTNTNKLLKSYPGANGVKTGYTEAAGDCLVAGAKRGDVQLIIVLLNDDSRWEDATKLLNYGFALTAGINL